MMSLRAVAATLALLFVAAIEIQGATDYCDKSLCRSGTHIACNNNGAFSSNCPSNAQMVSMTSAIKNAIVNAHNEKRNFVAGGGDPKLNRACRMATMRWNDELAAIAAYNVKQCQMKHDSCRNTAQFPYSGQNLAWKGTSGSIDSQAFAVSSVEMWYSEIKDCTMEYINAYPTNYQGPAIGHFTAMMVDSNTDVGCAAITYTQPNQPYNSFLMACNYARTNILGQRIYESCTTTGSKCTKGKNSQYSNLCATTETY